MQMTIQQKRAVAIGAAAFGAFFAARTWHRRGAYDRDQTPGDEGREQDVHTSIVGPE